MTLHTDTSMSLTSPLYVFAEKGEDWEDNRPSVVISITEVSDGVVIDAIDKDNQVTYIAHIPFPERN